jgi:hypothetical protein
MTVNPERWSTPTSLVFIGGLVPISAELLHLHFSFIYPREDERRARIIGRLVMRDIERQVSQDVNIWEHKRYLPTPALVKGDGPILAFRKWARQFYVPDQTDSAV